MLPEQRLTPEAVLACDEPLHGWNCFHLLKDPAPVLTESEQKEWDELRKYYTYDSVGDVDDAIAEDKRDIDRLEDEIGDMEEDITELYRYKMLLEKRLKK